MRIGDIKPVVLVDPHAAGTSDRFQRNFAGHKTIRAVGEHVKDHDALLNVFYGANVPDVLSQS